MTGTRRQQVGPSRHAATVIAPLDAHSDVSSVWIITKILCIKNDSLTLEGVPDTSGLSFVSFRGRLTARERVASFEREGVPSACIARTNCAYRLSTMGSVSRRRRQTGPDQRLKLPASGAVRARQRIRRRCPSVNRDVPATSPGGVMSLPSGKTTEDPDLSTLIGNRRQE